MKFYKLTNKGAALPTVIMVMLLTITFGGIVLNYMVSQTKTEVIYEDNIGALHAAEAGINKYLWSLNKDNTSDALDFDTVIKYPDINSVAEYKLHVVLDDTDQKIIESSGWMIGNEELKRTIKATIKKRSFYQYVYFSILDPADIWWGSSDNCYGPYHTNNDLYVMGTPTFWDDVSCSGILHKYDASSYPICKKSFIEKADKVDFPPNNNELMAYAMEDGTNYTGLTRIRLNSDGTITIRNENINPKEQTINIPDNGVIYVNGSTSPSSIFSNSAGNAFVSGTLDGRLTIGASNDIYITGYDPISNSLSTVTGGIKYKDTEFVLDTVNGKVTTTGTADDMLGLVANNNVGVLTRGWFGSGNSNAASDIKNFTIHAAIMALHGSFYNVNQNYPTNPGKLTVRGAIIQETRGAVGYGNTSGVTSGYAKDYAHDPRMKSDGPPNFLSPTNSGWEITEWTEIN